MGCSSGLMDESHRNASLAKIAPTAARGFVQRPRSLAAAGDQDGQLGVALLGSNLEKFRTDGQSSDLRFSGREVARSGGEIQESAADKTADLAIGETRHGVRFHHH